MPANNETAPTTRLMTLLFLNNLKEASASDVALCPSKVYFAQTSESKYWDGSLVK